jgi:hypothetical protein
MNAELNDIISKKIDALFPSAGEIADAISHEFGDFIPENDGFDIRPIVNNLGLYPKYTHLSRRLPLALEKNEKGDRIKINNPSYDDDALSGAILYSGSYSLAVLLKYCGNDQFTVTDLSGSTVYIAFEGIGKELSGENLRHALAPRLSFLAERVEQINALIDEQWAELHENIDREITERREWRLRRSLLESDLNA